MGGGLARDGGLVWHLLGCQGHKVLGCQQRHEGVRGWWLAVSVTAAAQNDLQHMSRGMKSKTNNTCGPPGPPGPPVGMSSKTTPTCPRRSLWADASQHRPRMLRAL